MNFLYLILCILLGYLLGSIPFALVIGKMFYKTDIRQYGSGNLGGTNAGRVLGRNAGIAVIACDILKVVLAMGLASLIDGSCSIWCGVACCIGHCYPVFAHFKGGKAVSTMFGFLVSLWFFTFHDISYALVPFGMFLVILFIFKYVSLASICASIASCMYITARVLSLALNPIFIVLASWIMMFLIIYRHRSNIQKIMNATENKISWL